MSKRNKEHNNCKMNASRQLCCMCNYAFNIQPSSGALYSMSGGVHQGHSTDLKATPLM